ncbi:MAG: bifunctional DNA primase/polymerase [Mycobacterium sp.]|nr:bifunctional DNA primase/polymerase [Mycobacterium sp.]
MAGYADYAGTYRELGWTPLPIEPGTKGPPPSRYTGYDAIAPSGPDYWEWTEHKANYGVALKMPDTVVGIDIDHYVKSGKRKRGGDTLAHAENLWGPLPDTYVSTARTDGVSGIRYFRVPAGTRLMSLLRFPELGLGDVEIIQWCHRYAVVAPSCNPDANDAPYEWMNTATWAPEDIPAAGELPDLPAAWLQACKLDAAPDLGGVQVDAEAILNSLPEGEMEMPVLERLDKSVRDIGQGNSRHDVTNANVLALLRLGEQGWVGVPSALRMLAKVFVASVGPDRGTDTARGEFWRMVTNRTGLAMLVNNPSPASTVDEVDASDLVAQVSSYDDDPEVSQSGDIEHGGEPDAEDAGTMQFVGLEPTDHIVVADVADESQIDPYAEFWRTRDSLAKVRQWGLARMCSPWALLGAVIARALATVPPWVCLPEVIGSKGSLNLFVALVGPSGTGKGAADSLAAEVVPADVHIGQAGSGEGLTHQYAHVDRKTGETIIDRRMVLFSVPEIDTLNALGGRTGSTIMSKLREAYSGEELGFGYADQTRRIVLGKHGYRLTMVVGVQPSRAGVLLDDAGGGTPQRFIWLPSTDPDISVDTPPAPRPIWVPPESQWIRWGSARRIEIPDETVRTIKSAHASRQRGEGHALDGHALFTREKVAFALAVLEGRESMNSDDWFLSGIVMDKSDETRNEIEKELRKEFHKENEQKGKAQGEMRSVAEEIIMSKKIENVRNSILRMMVNGTDTKHALYVGIWSKNREYFEPAFAWLRAHDCLESTAEGVLSLTEIGHGYASKVVKHK